MTGREIYEVMEQLNPTGQQEEQMYQNILSSGAEQEYSFNKKRNEAKGRIISYGKGMRYAAAVILLLVLVPTITYAAFHSAFLEKFFDIHKDAKETQDEEWLAQYVKEDLAEFSYGGYLFQLRGYLMNSQIGEGMMVINVKKEKETDYRLRIMPEEDEKLYSYYFGDSFSTDLSEDAEFKNQDLKKLIHFLPDEENEMRGYAYECRKTEDDNYEYRITLYSDYETIDKRMQQTAQSRKDSTSLNFYDGTGELVGKMPLNQGHEFSVCHWLSPSGQNNVVLTPFTIYATGVPGQLLVEEESKVIVTYQDGRKKEVEFSEISGRTANYNSYKTLKLNNVVNTTEVKKITIHSKDRDWDLDVEDAQQ